MASDHAYTHASGTQFKGAPKMMVLEKEVAKALFGEKKVIIGGAGNAESLSNAWRWLSSPDVKAPKLKGAEFVALTGSKKIYTAGTLGTWILVDQPYYAIGSGMRFAMGALKAGKSAVKAVEIAMESDPHTNFGVTEYKV